MANGMNKALILGLLLAAGCGGNGAARPGAGKPALPRNALPVPIVRQPDAYTCGVASLAAILYYWQVYDGNLVKLAGVTGTNFEGTQPKGIVKGAEKYGLKAYYKERTTPEDLRAALARGETVILDIQAWPDKPGEMPWAQRREDGHYVVLTAMDENYVYLMDPSVGAGYTYIKLPELMERWHDYENLKTGVWNTKQLAIFISGKDPLKRYPAPLTPTL